MTSQSQNSRQKLSPGLSIIHSNHLEDLRQVAVYWIKTHPLGVLETEQFIVQSNGMAQWLKLALAADDGCGISAGVEMKLPGRFVWTAYRAVLGSDTIPEESAYDKDRLIWRIFRLLPLLSDEPIFAPLNRFLEHDEDLRKRSQLACHLADLYDQYQVYRADWLEDWSQGLDRIARIGGQPAPLGESQQWQAELWRRIKADVPDEYRTMGRADLHNRFMEKARLLNGQRPGDLPSRVVVFGISSLPRQVLETLSAVSSMTQVLLFVHNPCRHFWADIVEDRELLRIENARHKAKSGMPTNLAPELIHQHANPLLAAWGKQGRDYIGLLYGYDEPANYETDFSQIDLFEDFILPDRCNPLLHQVQQAILDLEPLPGDEHEKQRVAPGDESISFQVAHSRQREVEILQDQLLHCFETLEDLKPRDIIVMTPDIDAYAPHIEAVFGNLSSTDSRFIPFTIADKPNRESVPLIKALEALLHVPDSRMGVSEVMDLFDIGAFRRRFGIKEEDLPKLRQWIEGAGISWGLNHEQRTLFKLPGGLEQNTWAFGLDRMLLGYAVGSGGEWKGIEPYGEVGGLEAALVGPLFDAIGQLEKLWQRLNQTSTPAVWCEKIRSLAQDFFAVRESQDQLTLSRLNDILDQWLDACDQAMLDEPLPLAVVREFLMARMKESSTSRRFLAGMVNFGTLMPMRAIPFKVVCLLGMNDGEFPRSHPPLDFDLMAGRGLYRPGDRSRREDDRYLFLESLLSARERLYISYIGRDDRDNSERMPSVLVGQFRDYLGAGWCLEPAEDGTQSKELLEAITNIHPLQPFGRDYFLEGNHGVFTYAHEWRTSLDPGNSEIPDSAGLLSNMPGFEGSLNLASLIRFFKNPVKYFFNQRLSVRFEDLEITGQDQEPFALDFLAPFGLGTQLLEAGLHAKPEDVRSAVEAEALRLTRTGALPMSGFGHLAADDLSKPVNDMLAGHQTLLETWPSPSDALEISLSIESDETQTTLLDDWLDKVYEIDASEKGGDSETLARFARWEFYPKSIMAGKGKVSRIHSLSGLWVKHVAGCAQGYNLASHLVAPDGIVCFSSIEKSMAQKILNEMVLCLFQGLRQPLPVTAKTGLVYAHTLRTKDEDTARSAAAKAYEGDGFKSGGELGYDAYLRRAYPGFEDLWQAHGNYFVSLCQILYDPLVLALEEEV